MMISYLTGEILTRAPESSICRLLSRDNRFGVVLYDFGCWSFDGPCCFTANETAIAKNEMARMYPDLEYLHDYVERKRAEKLRAETEMYATIH